MDKRIKNSLYDYRQLHLVFTEGEIETYYNRLLPKFASLTKNWNDDLESSWIARNYMAAKMVMSSTLLLNSVVYATDKNLKIVEPYLLYYALFSACRAVVYTIPDLDWKDGTILEFTHSKTINITADQIAHLNIPKSADIKKTLLRARDYRELFSYKFPANGLATLPQEVSVTVDETINLCRLLVEVAQFNSERLDQSYQKNCAEMKFGYDQTILEKIVFYETDDYTFTDDEDAYRISRITRKGIRPGTLYDIMNAGMVEDFFGSWTKEDALIDDFDPDHDWRLIFDFP